MTSTSEYKESVQRELERYDSFLKSIKALSDIAPIVSELRDEAQAKLNVLNYTPSDVLSETIPKILPGQLRDETKRSAWIPELPSLSREFTVSLVSSSGISDSYTTIVTPFLNVDPQPDWLKPVNATFTQFAEDKARRAILPGLIADIDVSLVEQFQLAVESYEKARSGIHRVDQALNSLRSVIQQLWGSLVDHAKIKCSENIRSNRLELKKVANREIVAACLGGTRVPEMSLHLSLLYTLYKDISSKSKNVLENDVAGMKQHFTEWILKINAILSIVADQNQIK